MTTERDLSGSWSVAAFHRLCARAHLDLVRLSDDDFVPALTACGALPPGWPEAVARRLALTMVFAMDWRDTPHYRDTFFTDARGCLVYHDGWDDLRVCMAERGIVEDRDDPPGSLRTLVEALEDVAALTDRLGPDRMEAFRTRLHQEGERHGPLCSYFLRRAAALGRHAGLRFENVRALQQANQDGAEARAAATRYQQWRGEPPLPDDTPPDEID